MYKKTQKADIKKLIELKLDTRYDIINIESKIAYKTKLPYYIFTIRDEENQLQVYPNQKLIDHCTTKNKSKIMSFIITGHNSFEEEYTDKTIEYVEINIYIHNKTGDKIIFSSILERKKREIRDEKEYEIWMKEEKIERERREMKKNDMSVN